MLVVLSIGPAPYVYSQCYYPVSNSIPEKVISLNQFATENMLLLDLEDHLIGTAYPDDSYEPSLLPKLAGIPELATRWPSKEQVVLAQPDFIYAGFPSAFSAAALGEQSQWHQWGIGTLIGASYCNPVKGRLQSEDIWTEITEVAELFARQPQLQRLKAERMQQLAQLRKVKPYRVLHIDMADAMARSAGGWSGADLLIRLAGGQNITANLHQRWVNLSWERVMEENPEVITIAVSQESTPDKAIELLTTHPALKGIDAVVNRRFVAIPFTETMVSPRLAQGVQRLNQALVEFQNKEQQ